jgi:WD40 repeat protein
MASVNDVARPTRSISVTSDGSQVAAVSSGSAGFVFTACPGASKMALYDVNEEIDVVTLDAENEAPSLAAVSHDAVKVAYGTSSGAVYLWDLIYPTTMESFRTEDSLAAGAITSLSWHPRGHVLAAASESGVVHLWDMVVGALLFPFPAHDGRISDIAWTGNGRILLTAGDDGALRAWSPRDVEFLGSVTGDQDDAEGKPIVPALGAVKWHTSGLTCLDAMMDMSRVTVSGARDGSVLLSVIKPEQGCGVFHAMQKHKSAVTAVKFSRLDCPKPLRAASAAEDGTVHLFDMDRRLPMGKFTHTGSKAVSKLAFNDTADVLFSASGSTVQAWDARVAPEEENPILFAEDVDSGHAHTVTDFTVVNDGATLVTAGSDGRLRLFDMRYPSGVAPSFAHVSDKPGTIDSIETL